MTFSSSQEGWEWLYPSHPFLWILKGSRLGIKFLTRNLNSIIIEVMKLCGKSLK